MSSLLILRADPSHASLIGQIGKQSFAKAFGHLFKSSDELSDYLQHTYEPIKLAKSIRKENNVYLLAWQNGEAIGFAKVKKYSLNDQLESISQMELQKIYVLPGFQGTGAGAALMDAILQLAAEVRPDLVWLDTHISNSRAISFYESRGFKKIGKHFFTIGTQTFEYHVMGLAISVNQIIADNIKS